MNQNITTKILVPTAILPPKKDMILIFLEKIFLHFDKKENIQIILFHHQPQKLLNSSITNYNIIDIHDFDNAKKLLEKIKPDCIIISQTQEPINYSLTLAAKNLGIPLIAIYLYDYDLTIRQENIQEKLQNFKSLIRNIFSNKMPVEQENEKKTMKRGFFMLYKYKFLIKTKLALKHRIFNILNDFIQDFKMFTTRTYPEYNTLADLNFLPNDSWLKPLINLGINKEKLIITGNPFWDGIYDHVKNRQIKLNSNKKIKILVLTDPLVEHGLWSEKYRDHFLTELFSELQNHNFDFSIKIHPSSENSQYYYSLLNKLEIQTKIFQKENLWDIVDNYDLVISYGKGYAHTELAAGLVKLILLDTKDEFFKSPLIEEAEECGHVLIVKSFSELTSSIQTMLKKQNFFTTELNAAREKLFFQFEGQSGKLASQKIAELLKNYQN